MLVLHGGATTRGLLGDQLNGSMRPGSNHQGNERPAAPVEVWLPFHQPGRGGSGERGIDA